MLIEAMQPAQPLPFSGLVNAFQGLQSFLGDHPDAADEVCRMVRRRDRDQLLLVY